MNFCPTCVLNRRRFLAGAATAAAAVTPLAAQAQAQAQAHAAPIVDFHAHVIEPSIMSDELRGFLNAMPRLVDPLTKPEAQIARMTALGIDRHVVNPAGAVQGISWGDAAHDLTIHKIVNDYIARDWIGRYPDRFMGSFGAPTQDLKLALPEVERMAKVPGMRMLQVSSHTPDKVYYGDPSLDPLMEALQDLGIILFIHPHLQMNDPPLNHFGLNNSIGQGIEEAKVMANIIYQGVFEKFPRLKILIAHGGGFLPHYGGRMDRNVTNIPGSAKNLTQAPSAYLKRFYYDTCVYGSDVLDRLALAVGADRIVLGGDYPLGPPDPLAEVRGARLMSAADKAAILAQNGARLLARP